MGSTEQEEKRHCKGTAAGCIPAGTVSMRTDRNMNEYLENPEWMLLMADYYITFY